MIIVIISIDNHSQLVLYATNINNKKGMEMKKILIVLQNFKELNFAQSQYSTIDYFEKNESKEEIRRFKEGKERD